MNGALWLLAKAADVLVAREWQLQERQEQPHVCSWSTVPDSASDLPRRRLSSRPAGQILRAAGSSRHPIIGKPKNVQS